MQRQILHIDVNNAFLSWTAVNKLNNGEKNDIRTIPSIIGGDETKRKGIVLAKSNLAKELGIKTGDPIFLARKKCPNIQIYQTEFDVYEKFSNKMYKILLEYTDVVERYSIDECFLDLTRFLQGNSLIKFAEIISKRINSELGFTVNVGVAHNKLLAKMASDFEKPNKIHTLFEDEIEEKMWKLPVSELFMVGRQTIEKLKKLGINTIKDLVQTDKNKIIKLLGKQGKLVWEYANGIDETEVKSTYERPKGIGNSITLSQDLLQLEEMEKVLLSLVEQVAYRLRKNNLLTNIINVQIKTSDFKVFSHQRKIDIATCSTQKIYIEAKKLLKELYKKQRIRLIGVRVEGLTIKGEEQISLFSNVQLEKQEKLDKTLDNIKQKYGYTSIYRAGGKKDIY